MASKITQAQWDKIGRQIVRASGGIRPLVKYVTDHYAYSDPQGTLEDWAKAYIREGNMWIYEEEKAYQLDKLNIPYRSADKKFNEVYGRATYYLVYQYLKEHGLMIEKTTKPYGKGYTYDIKVVKDPYSKKKTVKRK